MIENTRKVTFFLKMFHVYVKMLHETFLILYETFIAGAFVHIL